MSCRLVSGRQSPSPTSARDSRPKCSEFAYTAVVVVGLISRNDEKANLEEVADLSLGCEDNSLMLNFSKTMSELSEDTTSKDFQTIED